MKNHHWPSFFSF